MKMLITRVTRLLDVKTIVTMLVMLVYVVLALTGKIATDNVVMITTTVVAFYFGTQHQKKVAAPADQTEGE